MANYIKAFREICLDQGLLEYDNPWYLTLKAATLVSNTIHIRAELLAIISVLLHLYLS